jgi:hypothetical protein
MNPRRLCPEIPTLSDHPLLIGRLLARAQKREERRAYWRRLFGLDHKPKTHVARISATETIYSER